MARVTDRESGRTTDDPAEIRALLAAHRIWYRRFEGDRLDPDTRCVRDRRSDVRRDRVATHADRRTDGGDQFSGGASLLPDHGHRPSGDALCGSAPTRVHRGNKRAIACGQQDGYAIRRTNGQVRPAKSFDSIPGAVGLGASHPDLAAAHDSRPMDLTQPTLPSGREPARTRGDVLT